MVALLLVPSPLLGAASWAPVADLLDAAVVDLAGATSSDAVLDASTAAARAIDDPDGIVLVPHSNAGLYAPILAELVGARATVHVDAALPGTGPETALAPPAFLEFLEGLADHEGLLPPWTGWWDEADVAGLFPDASSRAAVETGQPRLPLSYFTSRVDVPRGWADRPHAYLAFGETYAEEIAFALARGWPVTGLPGRHLHQLVAPRQVAAAIADLTGRLTA